MAKRGRIYDFGFDPEQSPHHFAVVPIGAGGARLIERFDWPIDHKDRTIRTRIKAELTAYRWARICDPVADLPPSLLVDPIAASHKPEYQHLALPKSASNQQDGRAEEPMPVQEQLSFT